jgi:hypothetical protein
LSFPLTRRPTDRHDSFAAHIALAAAQPWFKIEHKLVGGSRKPWINELGGISSLWPRAMHLMLAKSPEPRSAIRVA